MQARLFKSFQVKIGGNIMIKKRLTYVNFNGKQVTKDYYFNLTAAEVAQMEIQAGDDGLKEKLEGIVRAKDHKELMEKFQDIIDRSYGVKSEDGETFIKTPENLAVFKSTQAYSDLFMTLATNEKEALAFVRGILPTKITSMSNDVKPNADPTN